MMSLILLFTTLHILHSGLSLFVSQGRRGTHVEVAFPQKQAVSSSQVRSSITAFFSSYTDNVFTSATPGSTHASGGRVSLVGSGPGDPELLTVQAMKLIQEADLVISDRLVSNDILGLVRGELKVANKKPGCAEVAQEEIYRWVCEGVEGGKNVVRLKIGDPYLFGRGGEEVLYFREHLQVEPFISPAVSSSFSAPLAAGIPLTHRGVSNQVLISTGYGKEGSHVNLPPYSTNRTIVLLMAVGRIAEIAQQMLREGYAENTPVAIVENATTPSQRTLRGNLATIGEVARQHRAKAPACVVIGGVVDALDPASQA